MMKGVIPNRWCFYGSHFWGAFQLFLKSLELLRRNLHRLDYFTFCVKRPTFVSYSVDIRYKKEQDDEGCHSKSLVHLWIFVTGLTWNIFFLSYK